MIPCGIVGVTEQMDFETNEVQTLLVIRLPNGVEFLAPVDDETRSAVVGYHVSQAGAPTAARRAAPPRQGPAYMAPEQQQPGGPLPPEQWDHVVEPDVVVFGGESNAPAIVLEDADTPALFVNAPDELRSPSPEPEFDPRAGKRHKRGEFISEAPRRTVPMNSLGYPEVELRGMDPDAITSAHGQDEDGVGSI